MIRCAADGETDLLLEVINDGARAYAGVIPADRYHEPYMARDALSREIASGVEFWLDDRDGAVDGIMGIQDVKDVTLIRHAYVRMAAQRRGIGTKLLEHLLGSTRRPVLIGTWKAATWAIDFYRHHGFDRVPDDDVPGLLRRYWSIPDRQIETSVVLAQTRRPRNPARSSMT